MTKEQVKNDIIKALEKQATTEDLQYYYKCIESKYLEEENDYLNYYIEKVLKEELDTWQVAIEMYKEEISNHWTEEDIIERISENISNNEELQERFDELEINIDPLIMDYVESTYEEILDNLADGTYESKENDGIIWYDVIEKNIRDIIKEKLKSIIALLY